MSYRPLRYTLLALLLFLPLASLAQDTGGEPPQTSQQEAAQKNWKSPFLKGWRKQIEEVDRLLQDGQSERALKKGDRLARTMVRKIQSGEGTGAWLGVVNSQRAIAATQSGDTRLGLWHWHIAIQMFPELTTMDLSAYGEAGEILKNHPLRPEYNRPPPGEGQEIVQLSSAMTRPKKKKGAPQPEIPLTKLQAGKPVSVIIQAIIDKNGEVRDPLILKSEGEFTVVCAVLEAMWQWEFEPGRVNGEPVDVYYNLAYSFRPGPVQRSVQRW